jgi:hypothetical protein
MKLLSVQLVSMRSETFFFIKIALVVTQSGLVGRYQRFGEAYLLHL